MTVIVNIAGEGILDLKCKYDSKISTHINKTLKFLVKNYLRLSSLNITDNYCSPFIEAIWLHTGFQYNEYHFQTINF